MITPADGGSMKFDSILTAYEALNLCEKGGPALEGILLVCEKGKQDALASLFKGGGFGRIYCAQNAGEARRMLVSLSFSLVVINAPLSDESGRDLSLHCVENSDAGVILLAAAASADKIAAGVEEYGVFVLSKPVTKPAFIQAVRLIQVSRHRRMALEKKNRQLLQKLEDMRYISRAKCALVRYRDMTEPEAHRYIEQTAMDRRISRRDVAMDILSTYEP